MKSRQRQNGDSIRGPNFRPQTSRRYSAAPDAAYSDFYFADQPAVEVGPAGVGRFQINVRNGTGRSSATEALTVARHAR